MTLDIAIIGGGIGGLAAAIALRQHPALDVQIYEQASAFRETGAAVGVAPNGLRTLEKLGVEDVLTGDLGWRNPSGSPMSFRHWKTQEVLSTGRYHDVPNPRHRSARMHRAGLQNALLKKLPKDIIHLNKRATDVKTNDRDEVSVTFEDGTAIKADLVIGADGIKSKVRRAFVPDHELSWTGEAIFRSVFPYALVADIKDLPQDSTQWTGPTAWLFGSRLEQDQYTITANFQINRDDINAAFQDVVWNVPAEVKTLHEAFKDFNPVVQAIVERVPNVQRYANVAGAALSQWTYGGGRVVLLGDAAHTHGGGFAAGASLAIDDAYALYLSFRAVIPEAGASGEPVPIKQLRDALHLYETTRRPHSGKLLEIVHLGHKLNRARLQKIWSSGIPETDEEFRARIGGRGDSAWLTEHDVEAAFRKVLTAVVEERREGIVNSATDKTLQANL